MGYLDSQGKNVFLMCNQVVFNGMYAMFWKYICIYVFKSFQKGFLYITIIYYIELGHFWEIYLWFRLRIKLFKTVRFGRTASVTADDIIAGQNQVIIANKLKTCHQIEKTLKNLSQLSY